MARSHWLVSGRLNRWPRYTPNTLQQSRSATMAGSDEGATTANYT
jgi:hypothetical protein